MPNKPITQREARRLRRLVDSYERMEWRRQNAFNAEYPGVHLGSVTSEGSMPREILTARKLAHAVVVTATGQKLDFYAVPLGKVDRK